MNGLGQAMAGELAAGRDGKNDDERATKTFESAESWLQNAKAYSNEMGDGIIVKSRQEDYEGSRRGSAYLDW